MKKLQVLQKSCAFRSRVGFSGVTERFQGWSQKLHRNAGCGCMPWRGCGSGGCACCEGTSTHVPATGAGGVHAPVTHASSSWGHCQSESSFAYSHNLWTFHPKHHAAQTMTDGDEAGAQGYSFCDQFPADSKTVFTSIFFSLMEGLPGKGRFLKLWLWRKKKTRKIST